MDDRMVYDMQEEKYLEELAIKRAEISNSKSKERRKELHDELLELTRYRSTEYEKIKRIAKSKSILKLQADMCTYIDWARYQASIREAGKNT